jgi:hypothetical protein
VRPAIVYLEVTPRGQIYVDGEMRGTIPPLTQLELDPGPHVIEVHNDPSPPLRLELTLGSGDEMTIRHAFVIPKPPAKSAPPKKKPETKAAPKPKPKPAEKPKDKSFGDYWRQFRRDIGL